MARRNRVTPLSELVADPARGLVYGNRGCLHDAAGQIRRRYAGRRWIACRLRFRGWQRSPLLQPGRFTELFFLDEATAMAAGHRACALCRRADYDRLVALWRELHPGQVGADAMDAQLHGERVAAGTRAQRHHEAPLDDLPDAAFVLRDGAPWLVLGGAAAGLDAGGLRRARAAAHARARACVITPPSLVAVLRAGWERAGAAAAPVGAGEGRPVGYEAPVTIATRRSHAATASSSLGASTMTRTSCSVPLGRTSTRPRPSRARASRSLASASSLLAIAASRSSHAHVDQPLGQLLHGVAIGQVRRPAAPRA